MADRATQRRALDTILADSETQQRLVTIHSASATTDVVAALGEHHVPGAVLHWFLGSTADLERAIDQDTYFSVNSAMLTSTRGRNATAQMPPNRVLVETDAPFAKRGKTPLTAGDVAHAESALARMWRLEPAEVRHRLWDNLRALQRRLAIPTFVEAAMKRES
jgi:TatD DNase family protein